MAGAFMGIVDGTGCWNDAEYAANMRGSFCSQLSACKDIPSHYIRGPSGEGYYIERRAKEIVERVRQAQASDVYLAGYSRGGSIVVIAARMLSEFGIGVKALFLFDPVARHGSASSEVIPGNVTSVYTARRIIGAREMDKYDYVLFGTTATAFESGSTRRDERVFLGSHGALGGVGWKEVVEDVPCQVSVATFFNEALTSEGLPSPLVSYPPTSSF